VVAGANRGACDDVGAMLGGDARASVNKQRGRGEGRAGGKSCACAFLPGVLGFRWWLGLACCWAWLEGEGSPGVGFCWARVGPKELHHLVPKGSGPAMFEEG
jgi:hypothetical protein